MSHPEIGGGHLCKRWDPNIKACLFRHLSWHGSPHVEEGDQWRDPKGHPRDVTSPAYTPLGKGIYESLLLDWVGPKPLPHFEPAWNPQWVQPFNDMSGLVEIGIAQQIAQHVLTPPPTSQQEDTRGHSWGPGMTDLAVGLAYAIGTAAAVAVVNIVARGAKGGAFKTAVKFGWDPKVSPLHKVAADAADQYVNGYVAVGTELLQERRPISRSWHGRNAANQNAWADPGLG